MALTSKDLKAQLSGLGYVFPFSIADLLKTAISTPGIVDRLSYARALIYDSKRFKSFYPGIRRPNGTLKMTPAEYENYVDSAKHAAGNAGFTISRKQVGQLVSRNVSADEFAFRVKVGTEIKANKDLLNGFNQTLKSKGLKPIKSAEQAFDFFTGRSNASVYDIYEEASFSAAAKSAGITITAADANRLGNRTAGVTSFEDAQEGFGEIAAQKKFADPELRAAGITLSTLEAAMFNNDPKAKAQIEQVLKQRKAGLEGTLATQKTGVTREGRPVTQSSVSAGY